MDNEPTLADAITAFEKRMKVSPTLRDALQFPEYVALVRAMVRERETLLRWKAEAERLTR